MTSGAGWALELAARAGLLSAARSGDDNAFALLALPHRQALHLHCYRMLGSLAEADDATGTALLRARRGLRGFRPEEGLHGWLLRAATITCLRAEADRARQPPGRRRQAGGLQPYPRALLDQLTPAGPDPAAEPGGRSTLAPPFVAALQLVPAPQRAVAVLHEVLGWPLTDVAPSLGLPVTAASRAWERARDALSATLGPWPAPVAASPPPTPDDEEALAAALAAAWRAGDVPALASLLDDDVVITLPGEPVPASMLPPSGPGPGAAATALVAAPPAPRRRPGQPRIEILRTAAAHGPALAVYTPGHSWPLQARPEQARPAQGRPEQAPPAQGRPEQGWRGRGVEELRGWALAVLTIRGEHVSEIAVFPDRGLFARFGLPSSVTLPRAAGIR